MKKAIAVLIVSVFSILPLTAHGEEKKGILVDAECGAALAGKPSSEADSHAASCELDPQAKRFGIIAEGKYFRFDDYGNKQARLLLRAVRTEGHLRVRVGGHFEEDLIKVSEIETIEESNGTDRR